MGDFNAVVHPSETSNAQGFTSSMNLFGDWIGNMGLSDHRYSGPWFTWSNNCSAKPILRRLDRILINAAWMIKFSCSDVVVRPPLFSDHCSILLNTDIKLKSLPKPFKFFRFWCEHPEYRDIVRRCWRAMFLEVPS
ncbi:hypothetical protein LINPERHAP2_LOCUS16915 [Linum perenne]